MAVDQREEPQERKGEAWGMLDFSEPRISLNQLDDLSQDLGSLCHSFPHENNPYTPGDPRGMAAVVHAA